jgi:hypothetical protein
MAARLAFLARATVPGRRRYSLRQIYAIGDALEIVCYHPEQLAESLPELRAPPGGNDEHALAGRPPPAQCLIGLVIEAEAVVGHAPYHAPRSGGCT